MRRSISRIFADLAAAEPGRVVVVDADGELSAGDLDAAASALAAELGRRGVRRDDLVAIALPNTRAFVIASVAVWRAGATPLPVAPERTPAQRAELVRVARPTAVIGTGWDDAGVPVVEVPAGWAEAGSAVAREAASGEGVGSDVPDLWAASWKAVTSSGSTGTPKVVVAAGPALFDPTRPVAAFLPREAVQLVAGPLSHSAVFTYAMRGLMTGHRLVVRPRFDERAWIDAVERHGVTWALVVPTMMHRLLRLPAAVRDPRRVASLRTVLHMGAPCPPELKRAFLEWIGPARVVEVYAGSESNGLTMIDGEEWLAHPGSVGRPIGGTEVQIRRSDGVLAETGEIGEVWMRRGDAAAYRYLGSPSRREDSGWDTLRDAGWTDEDGRLYLVDRLDDVMVRGGEKIYPAEVERVLLQHPAARSAVAFGVADADLGARVGAVVDVAGASVSAADLLAWAATRLDPARRPATIDVVHEPVRNDAGKTSRRTWAAREDGETAIP